MLKQVCLAHFELVVTLLACGKSQNTLKMGRWWTKNGSQMGYKPVFAKMIVDHLGCTINEWSGRALSCPTGNNIVACWVVGYPAQKGILVEFCITFEPNTHLWCKRTPRKHPNLYRVWQNDECKKLAEGQWSEVQRPKCLSVC